MCRLSKALDVLICSHCGENIEWVQMHIAANINKKSTCFYWYMNNPECGEPRYYCVRVPQNNTHWHYNLCSEHDKTTRDMNEWVRIEL